MDANHCSECHAECRRSCTGPGADNCSECVNVKDGQHCVAECPEAKYALNGICVPCHETCNGCTGPDNTISKHGCVTCDKAIINGDKVERCLRKEESCPGKCSNDSQFNHYNTHFDTDFRFVSTL